MPLVLTLVLLALLATPSVAAAQTDLPIDPSVPVPGAPAGEQPPAGEEPPQTAPEPECNPELQACGQPCAPDVDAGCAPECDDASCASGGGPTRGGDEGDEAPEREARERAGRVRPVAARGGRRPRAVAVSRSPAASPRATLPATGAEPWQVALLGLLLLSAGLRLRAAAARDRA